MKKVTAREFQHHFGKLAASLKPGESLKVVRNGRVDGIYQKVLGKKIPFPDYKTFLAEHEYSEAIGDAVLSTLDAAVS